MRKPKTIVALAATTALALGGLAVAPGSPANASTEIDGQVAKYTRDGAGSLAAATLDATHQYSQLEFTWNAPLSAAGRLRTDIQTSMYIGGTPQFTAPAQVNRTGDTVELVSVDPGTGIEVVRTIRMRDSRVDVTIEATNTTPRQQNLQLDLRHFVRASMDDPTQFLGEVEDGKIIARSVTPGYDMHVEFGGDFQTSGFAGEPGKAIPNASWGQDGPKGAQAPDGGASSQGAGWWRGWKSGETVTASISVELTPQLRTQDVDEDGIPDEWERGSFTPEGGQRLDLAKWGARPDQKDVFLQLNWMEPEFNENACNVTGRFAKNIDKTMNWVECAEVNKNAYRPSKQILDELVKEFDENGVKLHIDAGNWYSNFVSAEPEQLKGGPIKFEKHPFNGKSRREVLDGYSTRLLKNRDAVFHLGVIGDQMAPGNNASGLGAEPGGSFYVAWYAQMNRDEQVRNTILHEFGHNLGLGHSGAINQPNRAEGYNYVPGYKSTMNYLYQFEHFGFTKGPSHNPAQLEAKCASLSAKDPCFTGTYEIGADWDNLTFTGGKVGRAIGHIEVPEVSKNEDVTTRDLVVIAAAKNNGKGGFRLVDTEERPNGIVTANPDNVIHAEVSNHGVDEHTYLLEYTYNGDTYTEKYTVPGVNDPSGGTLLIDVPVPNLTGYKSEVLPIRFSLYNEQNEVQYSQDLNVPVLDLTKEELREVVEQLPTETNEKLKKAVDEKLKPAITATATPSPSPTPSSAAPTSTSAPAPVVPTPVKTRPNQPVPVLGETAVTVTSTATATAAPDAAPVSDSPSPSNIAAIITGLLMALGGIGIAAWGWVNANGMPTF
ncbi:hypothetical protein [Corynebacterium hadale]|uniref:hypothetical protein n=1 Tax=Corynebacterium hadale TaxID=2026255 RepID=UPI001055AEB3|nr:hypothetical protein [Corynebacterium hadale]